MKLFLSSAENGDKVMIKYLQKYSCKYYLYSFYNFKTSSQQKINKHLTIKGEIFLDSGAHTLQKPNVTVDWDKFVYEYIGFINKYKQHLDYIVELDVENKIGLPLVEKYRKQIKSKTNIEPIVVWHRERGFDYLKYMCRSYKYIGFSGFVEDKTGEEEVPEKFINVFCDMAHKEGGKVHGFGYTRANIIEKRFDSVDSSSWKSGVRYGQLVRFENNRIKNYKTLRNYSDKYDVISEWCVREWVKYQQFLDKIK